MALLHHHPIAFTLSSRSPGGSSSMQRFVRLLAVLGLVSLAGCVPMLRGPAFSEAPTPPISSSLATVYLWRFAYDWGASSGSSFYLDGERLVWLATKQYTWFQVEPGELMLAEGDPDHGLAVRLPTRAGETYYVGFEVVAQGHVLGGVSGIAMAGAIPIPILGGDTVTGSSGSFSREEEPGARYYLQQSDYVASSRQ